MAKRVLINRELGCQTLAKKFATKREATSVIINDVNVTGEKYFEVYLGFQSTPRNAAFIHQCCRCALTGCPRGAFRKFGLGRIKIRGIAMRGEILGVAKAS